MSLGAETVQDAFIDVRIPFWMLGVVRHGSVIVGRCETVAGKDGVAHTYREGAVNLAACFSEMESDKDIDHRTVGNGGLLRGNDGAGRHEKEQCYKGGKEPHGRTFCEGTGVTSARRYLLLLLGFLTRSERIGDDLHLP